MHTSKQAQMQKYTTIINKLKSKYTEIAHTQCKHIKIMNGKNTSA